MTDDAAQTLDRCIRAILKALGRPDQAATVHINDFADLLMAARLSPRSDEAKFFRTICRKFIEINEGFNYAVNVNGEAWLVERLGSDDPKVILDGGCNRGDWSALALRHNPRATVHAFEIVPTNIPVIQRNLSEFLDRLTINPLGLYSHACEMDMWVSGEGSTTGEVAGTVHFEADGPRQSGSFMRGKLVAGDDYVEHAGIKHVDLLKLDIENAEFFALLGFRRMLQQRRIDVIQFEYANIVYRKDPPVPLLGSEIATCISILHFRDLLDDHGYALGKLFWDGVDFKPLDEKDEYWHNGPNWVACRRDRQDLIDLIRRR